MVRDPSGSRPIVGAGTSSNGAVEELPRVGGVVGVALAAGEGRRLRPLTLELPKPLCPVGGTELLAHALGQLEAVTSELAVNCCHGRDAFEAFLDRRAQGGHPSVHVSVEQPEALGTAGALGALRGFLDGRAVLVINADTLAPADLAGFVASWDGETPSVLLHGTEVFGPRVGLVASVLPWATVAQLRAEPSGLYEVCLAPAARDGRLRSVRHDGGFFDCGTPASYLAANLAGRPRGSSVVGAGAVIDGEVRSSVVWPGGVVRAGERLHGAIRTTEGRTVLVRASRR